jgi:hypothetical protein
MRGKKFHDHKIVSAAEMRLKVCVIFLHFTAIRWLLAVLSSGRSGIIGKASVFNDGDLWQ